MKARLRWYLVARGAACVLCVAHGWRAFRDPEEKDIMSPCTLEPIFRVQARNKREAVATVVSRMAEHTEEKAMDNLQIEPQLAARLSRLARVLGVPTSRLVNHLLTIGITRLEHGAENVSALLIEDDHTRPAGEGTEAGDSAMT